MIDTPEILSGVLHVSDLFNGILLDAYGVFWGGNDFGLLPGSKEIMENLVKSGKVVGVLSNSTQLSSKEIKKLNLHGLFPGIHFNFLITSGDVLRYVLLNEKLPFETPENKFCLFGEPHPKFSSHEVIFQGTRYKETLDIHESDFVYVSIPHINGEDQINPESFRKEIKKLKMTKLPMICPNPDLFAHEGMPPRAVVRQGSIARIYEEIGGQVFYFGKPYDRAYSFAMSYFQKHKVTNPLEILMIGDTPETDIRGARHFGMGSALITQTGIMGDRISQSGLTSALNALSFLDKPDYFLERL